jgi:quinolinate synthase
MAGSTSYIINAIEKAEPGSAWAIGTEMNLVNRLIKNHPDKKILSLNPYMCPCLTMNRIDLPHLVWSLDTLEDTKNIIKVAPEIADNAKLALDRMLQNS